MIPAFLALLLQATTPPVATCTETAQPPAGLQAWSGAPAAAADALAIGQPVTVTLQPADKVTFVPPPERAPKPGTFAGVYRLTVATAGTYRIALSAGAWIDVMRDGARLASIAHTEGPPCSGIRKIVDFALAPGGYTIQLSGAAKPDLRVLITAK